MQVVIANIGQLARGQETPCIRGTPHSLIRKTGEQ
jgi:hypothetical protein